MKAVVVVSGGMDSVTLAHSLKHQGDDVRLVSFDYGQRHKKELEYAAMCAEDLHAHHDIIPMDFMAPLLHGSALTDDIDVPEGHYADENMRLTVVPNRNAIMIAIATGIAVANKADYVAVGVHAGDHPVYPDCRPEFIRYMSEAMLRANEGFVSNTFQVIAPFVNYGKEMIVAVGMKVGVDYTRTWSCYKGGELHCGRCGTCVERKEAFQLNGVNDPTTYEV